MQENVVGALIDLRLWWPFEYPWFWGTGIMGIMYRYRFGICSHQPTILPAREPKNTVLMLNMNYEAANMNIAQPTHSRKDLADFLTAPNWHKNEVLIR